MTTTIEQDQVVRTLAGTVRPMKAARALWAFLLDKEDTASVIRVFRAADGTRPERNFGRFCATDLGRRVLAEHRSLGRMLCDRASLRALPADSLGRAYLAFAEREQISIEGLTAASEVAHAGRKRLEPARVQFRDRFRDMHDLWHVTTGYGRDALGETCLLAFSFAQTRQRGFALVAAVWSMRQQVLAWRSPVLSCVIEGARLGRRAEWLLAQDWERLLEEPLPAVRQKLGISAPQKYLQHLERTGDAGGRAAGTW